MAIIRGAYGGGQIKGSISGNTYQGSPYGQMIRNRTVPVNPNTAAQSVVRSAMAYASNYWSSGMSAAEIAAWKAYADITPLTDRFGTTQYVSARAMFMRTNINNTIAGLPINPVAPPSPGIAPVGIPQFTLSNATGIIVTNISVDPVGGGLWIISVSPPVGIANNFFKGPFGGQNILTDAADLPMTIKTPSEISVGQYYFVRYRSASVDGKVSNSWIEKIGPIVA